MVVLDRLITRISPGAALRRAIRHCAEGRPADAFRLLTRSANAGIVDAKYRIGLLYLQGSGVPPSRVEAARWLERAAGEGHAEAQSLLAALYVHGLASVGHSGNAGTSADRLFTADEPTDPDFQSALKWARRAADTGWPKGQAMLAYILTCGPEEMRDLEAAHRWYERFSGRGLS